MSLMRRIETREAFVKRWMFEHGDSRRRAEEVADNYEDVAPVEQDHWPMVFHEDVNYP